MELSRLSIERKISISFNKENTLLHKKYRMFMPGANMLLSHSCMVIHLRIIVLPLSIPILIICQPWLKVSAFSKKMLRIYAKIQK
jgi:hypothetical protein